MNKIILGHAKTELPKLPAESINCCVTSPPYWGLRDYGIEPVIWDGDKDCKHIWKKEITKRPNASGGKTDWAKEKLAIKGVDNYQEFVDYYKRETTSDFCLKCNAWRGSLGLEPTFELYIKHLCDIFDEIERVLRKDGTCWVNLGDTYWGGGQGGNDYGGKFVIPSTTFGHIAKGNGYQAKSLTLIPQRFAIEMINRGWILRNTIIWHKPNCMPSSAKDRFTVDFEYVFFFTRSNKALFWTNERTLECVRKQPLGTKGIEGVDWEWQKKESSWQRPSRDETFKLPSRKKSTYAKEGFKKVSLWSGHDYWFEQQFKDHITQENRPDGIVRNRIFNYDSKLNKLRGFKIKQIEEEIQGPQHHGKDINYGKSGRNKRAVWTIPTKPFPEAHFAVYPEKLIEPMIQAGCPKDGVVLDPFMGAGTTAVVAKKQGKQYLGIEIKQEYIDMANKRIKKIPELLWR